MTYDDFLESKELMLEYAQNAINIYHEIYDSLPEKFKSRQFGEEIPNVKALTRRYNKTQYIVDDEEAVFYDHGIEFTQEIWFRGELEEEKLIVVYGEWIIPDKEKQRKLIQRFINNECEDIREYIENREAQIKESKKEQEKIKEQREHEEYLRLKQKFES